MLSKPITNLHYRIIEVLNKLHTYFSLSEKLTLFLLIRAFCKGKIAYDCLFFACWKVATLDFSAQSIFIIEKEEFKDLVRYEIPKFMHLSSNSNL